MAAGAVIGILIYYFATISTPEPKTFDDYMLEYTKQQLEWWQSPEYDSAHKRLINSFKRVNYLLDSLNYEFDRLFPPVAQAPCD